MGNLSADITSLPFVRTGSAAFAAAFAFLFSFYRLNPDRRQFHTHVRRIYAVVASRVGVGHGFVFLMFLLVAFVGFRIGFFRFRRVRHGEQFILLFPLRRRSLLCVFRFFCFVLLRFLLLFRRKLPHPVGQHEFRGLFQILGQYVFASGQSGFGPGGFHQVNVGPVPGYVGFDRINGGQPDHGVGYFHFGQQRPGFGNFLCQSFRFRGPVFPESFPVFFKRGDPAHDFHPGFFVGFRFYRNKQPETVQSRRGKSAAFRRHDGQHRVFRVPVFGEAVPFQLIAAGFLNPEYGGQNIVPQQVGIVKVDDASVRFVDQPRLELPFAVFYCSFGINGAKQPVFCNAYGNLDPGCVI